MLDSSRPNFLLIRNATVLTVDLARGTQENSDILIKQDRIVAIGQGLAEPAEGTGIVIDAQGCIVTPGFVDGHHHMWQQLLRAEDVYLSTYVAALSLINNGVTTVLDHCHIMNSPDHADAAVRAMQDADIRGTFCYGFYANVPIPDSDQPTNNSEPQFTHALRIADAARIKEKYFSCNDPNKQRVTFGIAPDEPEAQLVEETIRQIQQARDLGARIITMHVALGPCDRARHHVVQQIANAGYLGPDIVFSHGASLTEDEFTAIKTSGAGIVGTPDTELQMGMGFPIVFPAADKGCRACLGIDITSNQGNDFLAQMRLALQTSDALRMGTLGGAEVMRLENLVGSIALGKKADLVIFRCDDIENSPVADPVGAVVFHSSVKHIDTVIIDGHIRKRDGKLEEEWKNLRDEVGRRSQHIKAKASMVDLTAARARWIRIFETGSPD